MKRWIILLFAFSTAVQVPAVLGDTGLGSGDFEFFVDSATFRAEDGRLFTELCLRVANSELRFKESNGRFENRSRLSYRVSTEDNKTVLREEEEITLSVAEESEAASAVHFQTIVRKFHLPPGEYRLSCAMQDLSAPKMTVVGIIKKDFATALAERLALTVPALPANAVTLSDGKFLWDIEPRGGDLVFHPNPSRLYGLYRDTLRVYLEAYFPSGSALDDLAAQSVILDEQGEVVREASIPIGREGSAGGTTVPIVVTEDLNYFVAGTYTLYVGIARAEELLVKLRCGKFNVAWDMRTWEASRRNFLAEARFLMGDKEFDEFKGRSIGEQELMLAAMWKELDPDPTTGNNEARERFQDRLEYVNANYSDYQLGVFTDRGMVYMRYGPPDEMVVDVIPLNRESISDALQKVDDKFHPVNFSTTGGRISYADPSRNIIIDPRRVGRVGEGGEVAYPYELWIYNDVGDPILKRDKVMEQDIGLRFIFIDREGFGRYKLESSSLMTPK